MSSLKSGSAWDASPPSPSPVAAVGDGLSDHVGEIDSLKGATSGTATTRGATSIGGRLGRRSTANGRRISIKLNHTPESGIIEWMKGGHLPQCSTHVPDSSPSCKTSAAAPDQMLAMICDEEEGRESPPDIAAIVIVAAAAAESSWAGVAASAPRGAAAAAAVVSSSGVSEAAPGLSSARVVIMAAMEEPPVAAERCETERKV